MFTRPEYMKTIITTRAYGEELHRKYYGEIVQAMGGFDRVQMPCTVDDVRIAIAGGDTSLNSIQLKLWDSLVSTLGRAQQPLKDRGDYLTLGNGVCILKEAARQKAEAAGPWPTETRFVRFMGSSFNSGWRDQEQIESFVLPEKCSALLMHRFVKDQLWDRSSIRLSVILGHGLERADALVDDIGEE